MAVLLDKSTNHTCIYRNLGLKIAMSKIE